MILCVGGVVVDRKLRLHATAVPASSNPASASVGSGGVARNVAENLANLGVEVALVSRIGDDEAGRTVLAGLGRSGVGADGVAPVPGALTAEYVAVLQPSGDLLVAAAVMDVLDGIALDDVLRHWPTGPDDRVFADANLTPETLAGVVGHARRTGIRLALDAVSVPKAARLPRDLTGVDLLFCNLDEAVALAGGGDAARQPVGLARVIRQRGVRSVVLTLGAHGALLAGPDGDQLIPAGRASVVDVTGAGDALVAMTLARLVAGDREPDAVRRGVERASQTLASPLSVLPGVTA